ncbi:MAG TPA: hypothetical protein VM582_02715 [Candidatus Thermoplasmatota archaeon]|nr:hypothetical protein [Candidatus Thermoplasmatota archaeon]
MVLLLSMSTVGGATVLIAPPTPEQLVEGHTVFVAIDFVRSVSVEEEFAAAVAVLVRDLSRDVVDTRFPGVLWFNDQFLIGPTKTTRQSGLRERFPCTGAVLAVNRGDPVDADAAGRWTLIGATYLDESYWITDPNERDWIVDLWRTTHGTLAWTVAIMNRDIDANKPDDGRCNRSPYSDVPCYRLTSSSTSCTRVPVSGRNDPRHADPGENGMRYPCPGCSVLDYNAVLYFRLAHLRHENDSKDHRERVGADWWADASGCHPSATNEWPCPGGDDDREGNSHPFNPHLPYPVATYEGHNNHGGSAECPDGSSQFCHATFDIDLYYGYVQPPTARTFWLIDRVGAAAPYHCHDDRAPCDLRDHVGR